MYLLTLGRLGLDGSPFRRQKPMLLLAHLVLAGPRSRRHLADLFWPGASDNLNSLSVALSQIRRGTEVMIHADDQHVWCELASDVTELRQALRTQDLERALELYRGQFLDGADTDLGAELEEWLLQTREAIAQEVQNQLLEQAGLTSAVGAFRKAAALTARAWELHGAPEPAPEALTRYHTLLAAGEHPLHQTVQQAAAEYGIELSTPAAVARAALQQQLLGRTAELRQLNEAAPGSWIWLHGPEGMGKTTLLQQLQGTYMPARSGLPYASLEPLLAHFPDSEPPSLKQTLSRAEGTWLIDDWEHMDAASREVLTQLNGIHIRARVIVSSTQPAPFPVESQLHIGPLGPEALQAVEQGWERTGGLPLLVSAVLNGQPTSQALSSILDAVAADTQEFLQTLSLLETPDPAVARQALGLTAQATAVCLDELRQLGLIDGRGQIRAVNALRELVRGNPVRHAELSLRLARCLPAGPAHGFWIESRALWADQDLPLVKAAMLTHAEQLLQRGFPLDASEALQLAPEDDDVLLLRAKALERAGRYREALELLKRLDSATPEQAALRAAVLMRLGRNNEALTAAHLALEGGIEDRAWGQNVIGMIGFAAGKPAEAAAAFRRSAALWHAVGDRSRRADALNNLAVMHSELGESDSLSLFAQAEELASGNIAVLSRVLLNRARVLERHGDSVRARRVLKDAAALTAESGDIATAARIHNNLGALEHRLGLLNEAATAYRDALELAADAGEQRLLAVTLANLAELEEDFDAWQEAVRMFVQAGADPQELVDDLPESHPFRERSGNPD